MGSIEFGVVLRVVYCGMTSEHEYNANDLSNNTIVRTAHISIIESLRVRIIQVVYARTPLADIASIIAS